MTFDLDLKEDSIDLVMKYYTEKNICNDVELNLVSNQKNYIDLLVDSTSDYFLRDLIGRAKYFNDVDVQESLKQHKEIHRI